VLTNSAVAHFLSQEKFAAPSTITRHVQYGGSLPSFSMLDKIGEAASGAVVVTLVICVAPLIFL
jgi:hypothetical protein